MKILRFIFTAILMTSSSTLAQSVIDIRRADELRGREIFGEAVRELIGNVHFIQKPRQGSPVKVWCDRALQYLRQNKIELFGNVRIVQDTFAITAAKGTYFGNERRASVSTGVRMEQGSVTLTSVFGEYFAETKNAHFYHDVRIVDTASTTTCDTLLYVEEYDRYTCIGRVEVTDLSSTTTIFGDSLVHYRNRGYTIVPRSPKLLQVDSTDDGGLDSLLVVSRLIEAIRLEGLRVLLATDSVRVARNDIAAKAGRMTFYPDSDKIALELKPILWHDRNQITGDSIGIALKDRALDRIFVQGKAMAISRSSIYYRRRFDQLSGRTILLRFHERKLSEIMVDRNATSLYYRFDDGEPNGANFSTGDRIRLTFQEGELDEIRVYGGVEAKFFPEAMLENREQTYNLDGFNYSHFRPKRRGLKIIDELHD